MTIKDNGQSWEMGRNVSITYVAYLLRQLQINEANEIKLRFGEGKLFQILKLEV
jgi:hypothetical protein